jgi:hypothetical protein
MGLRRICVFCLNFYKWVLPLQKYFAILLQQILKLIRLIPQQKVTEKQDHSKEGYGVGI